SVAITVSAVTVTPGRSGSSSTLPAVTAEMITIRSGTRVPGARTLLTISPRETESMSSEARSAARARGSRFVSATVIATSASTPAPIASILPVFLFGARAMSTCVPVRYYGSERLHPERVAAVYGSALRPLQHQSGIWVAYPEVRAPANGCEGDVRAMRCRAIKLGFITCYGGGWFQHAARCVRSWDVKSHFRTPE